MKKIFLWLSIISIFIQNGFANNTDKIQHMMNNLSAWEMQLLSCEASVSNNKAKTSSPSACIKSINEIKKSSDSKAKKYLAESLFNTGLIFYLSENNKIKAYKYWYKAAELGLKQAQENLEILCRNDSWACK